MLLNSWKNLGKLAVSDYNDYILWLTEGRKWEKITYFRVFA